MSELDKRKGDKLAHNTNLTIKVIGFLIISLISLIAFGVNLSVDIAKTVGDDIRTIRDTVFTIQRDNVINSQAIVNNTKNIERHEKYADQQFQQLRNKINQQEKNK